MGKFIQIFFFHKENDVIDGDSLDENKEKGGSNKEENKYPGLVLFSVIIISWYLSFMYLSFYHYC